MCVWVRRGGEGSERRVGVCGCGWGEVRGK